MMLEDSAFKMKFAASLAAVKSAIARAPILSGRALSSRLPLPAAKLAARCLPALASAVFCAAARDCWRRQRRALRKARARRFRAPD